MVDFSLLIADVDLLFGAAKGSVYSVQPLSFFFFKLT